MKKMSAVLSTILILVTGAFAQHHATTFDEQEL